MQDGVGLVPDGTCPNAQVCHRSVNTQVANEQASIDASCGQVGPACHQNCGNEGNGSANED
jgi:hypothetical protein